MVQEQLLSELLLEDDESREIAQKDESVGVSGLRVRALESFKNQGFPGRKTEEYRFLNFEPVLHRQTFLRAQGKPVQKPVLPAWSDSYYRVVMVNGRFIPEWSELEGLPATVTICSLQDALHEKNIHALSAIGTLASFDKDPFMALNAALFHHGLFVYIPEACILDKPLHLIFQNQGDEGVFVQPRALILQGENSEAKIIQDFSTHSAPYSFSNAVCEIQLAENAKLDLYSLQCEDDNQSLVNTTEIHIRKHAVLKVVNFTLGGKLVRNNLNVVLDSPECEAHLSGYYHPGNGQTFDNHTLVDHRHPRCNSNELYKGVIGAGGHAVFNGKVFVRKDAQKTNAYQNNRNILLSDDAMVNTKPQLEIYADDVKCSHGSSTGYLDPEQLFYLRSRGISREVAKRLLLKAYAGEIIEKVNLEELRNWIEQKFDSLQN